MARALRTSCRALRAWPAARSRLLRLFCALATVLSLALSACASGPPLFPTDQRDPCRSYSEAPPPVTYSTITVSAPLVANGVVYVSYAIPEVNTAVARYALAALRVRDGVTLWRVADARRPLAVVDGVLLVDGLAGRRASDGTLLWQAPLGPEGAITLGVSGHVLYAFRHDTFYAIRIADGRVLWQSVLQQNPGASYPVQFAPVVDGNAVYFGEANGNLVALRADTGAVLWTNSPDPARSMGGYVPLAVLDGWLYVYISGLQQGVNGVLSVNPANGAVAGYTLSLPAFTTMTDSALVADVFAVTVPPVYTSATSSTTNLYILAYRLRANGSQLLWRFTASDSTLYIIGHSATALYLYDFAYATTYAVRLSDGAVRWHRRMVNAPVVGVVTASGYLVAAAGGMAMSCSGRIMQVNRPPEIDVYAETDGSVVWTRALDATV